MTLFSKIKNAKKAADQHRKSASIAATDVPVVNAPYKHVPTHAGQDSMNLGSSTGMGATELRAQIKEANRRRSELIRSASANDVHTYGASSPMSRSRDNLQVPNRYSYGQPPTTSRERLQVYRGQSQYGYNPMRSSRSSSSNSLSSLSKGKSPLSKMSTSIAELPEDEGDDYPGSSANSDSSATSAEAIEIPQPRSAHRVLAGSSNSSPPKRSILSRGSSTPMINELDIAQPMPVQRTKSLRWQQDEDECSIVRTSSNEARVPVDSKAPSPTLGSEWNWYDNSAQLALEQQKGLQINTMPVVERSVSSESKHQRIDSRMSGNMPEVRAAKPAVSAAQPPPIPLASKPATRPSSSEGPSPYQYTQPLSRTHSPGSDSNSLHSEQYRYQGYTSSHPQEYFDRRNSYNNNYDSAFDSSATPSPQLQAWQVPAENAYTKRQIKQVVASVVPTPMEQPVKAKKGMFRMPSLMKKSKKTAIAV